MVVSSTTSSVSVCWYLLAVRNDVSSTPSASTDSIWRWGVEGDVFRGDQPAALGRVAVPEAGALVDREDVGRVVGNLGQRGDVALHDPLLFVPPTDEVVHVEPHPELGGTKDPAVRVEVVVRCSGRREAQRAASGQTRSVGDSLLLFLFRLFLLGLILLVGLRRLLIGLLILLLLHGLLLLLLHGLLLCGLLLRLLLLLRLGDCLLTVVVIVAAADQGESRRADTGAR